MSFILNCLIFLRCAFSNEGHRYVFRRNIYGDEILLLNARSIWRCEKCGCCHLGNNLVE